MALNDKAVLTAAKGYIYVADADTPAPEKDEISGFDPEAGLISLAGSDGTTEISWTQLGHTSRDDLPEFGFDGGDSEVKGTWQKASLKTVQSEAEVDTIQFSLLQFDALALSLYYGMDVSSVEQGVYSQTASSTKPTRKALCIIIVDGDDKVGYWAGRTDIKRADSMELEVDEFASMPLQATVLDGPTGRQKWISEEIQTLAA